MKFTFCPYCGYKLNDEFAFCPKCGKRLPVDGASDETTATTSETVATTGETEDLFGGALAGVKSSSDDFDFSLVDKALDEKIKEKEELDKKRKLIRVLCIRGKFDEATALCNELLESDPEDYTAYVGFVRIESKNYTVFEGEEIEKAVEVVRQIFSTDFDSDADFSAYLKKREDYFAEKKAAQLKAEEERKAKAEAEKKAKEESDRKAKEEAERKAKEEAARKVKEAAERKVKEEAARKAKAEAARRAKEEAERRAKAEAARKVKEEAERKAKIREEFEIEGTKLKRYKKKDYTGEVVIPDGITDIVAWAFSECKLTSVQIPISVTSIGEGAFYKCNSLKNINSQNIPGSVTSIGRSAFYECPSLTYIFVPNSVKSIGEYAFGWNHCVVYFEGSSSIWNRITNGYCMGNCEIHFKIK